MRTRACALALLVTLSPAMFPVGAAFAEDAMTEMARERFQEGVKFFDQKKYEQARAAFLQAYALKRHPAVLLNLAQSELRANRPADAARHFAQYLRENPGSSSLEKQEAERGLAEARAKSGRVLVTVNTAGADVFVNDELIGKAPLAEPVDVSVGDQRVEARLGEHSAAVTVTTTAGKVVEAKLVLGGSTAPALVPSPMAPQPPPATDGGFGAQPAPVFGPPPMASGGYPGMAPPGADSGVTFSTSGRQPFFHWVTREPIAWATLGVTAVGVGLGTVGLLSASSAGSKADDLTIQIQQRWSMDEQAQAQRPNGNVCADGGLVTPGTEGKPGSNFANACGKLQSKLDDESNAKTLAWVGVGVAGAGVAATAIAYFLTSKKSEQPAAVITPVYGPDVAGLAVSGSF